MRASLWSDDEDNDNADTVKPITTQAAKSFLFGSNQPQDKYTDLFGFDNTVKVGKMPLNKNRIVESLFGGDDDDDDDTNNSCAQKGAGKPLQSTSRSSEKLDLFAEDDDEDDEEEIISPGARVKPQVDLFADDDDDDDEDDDDIFVPKPMSVVSKGSDKSYKLLYEREVAKCTQLELTVESLLEKITVLEEQLEGSGASTLRSEEAEIKSMKAESRQLRQKNRQKLQAARHKPKTKDSDGQNVANWDGIGPSSPDVIENIENSSGTDFGGIDDSRSLLTLEKKVSGVRLANETHGSSDNEVDVSNAKFHGTDSAVDIETSTKRDKDNKFVSSRQKQILARQARSRAALKLKAEKTKNSSVSESNGVDNMAQSHNVTIDNGVPVSSSPSAMRRGSTGGLKYDGGGWQSSSDEEASSGFDSEDSSDSDSDGNGKDTTSQKSTEIASSIGTESHTPFTVNAATIAIEVDPLDTEVDKQVRDWCSRQLNLVTMIRSIPEIYKNENLPTEIYQVDYSSSPNEIRKAYLKIARYCHPDKQKRLVNAGQSRRDQLIAEKLFSALADAYNAYKIQFDL
jgi:hypothetical protein